jgi:lysophospholipase L1-like esterase
VPGLPRVLLIGDSISIGYTLPVREKLKGKANVHRIPINGGATEVGLESMKSWLGDGKWDVIHFNFGLHDAKYMSETTLRATREQYLKNLQELVNQMKASGAKLIFATTTPTPAKLSRATRRFDSIPERNEIAVKLMQENGVAIDDLYAVVLPVQEKIQRPGDVHYTPEGYDILSIAVAKSVEEQLPPK